MQPRASNLTLLRQLSTKPTNNVSPFVGTWTKITGYNLFRTICLSWLGVVRFALVVFVVATCSLLCWLALIGSASTTTNQDMPPPLEPWRQKIARPIVQFASRLVLLVMGFYWIPVVKGRPDPSARVYVCNHTSLMDVLVLLWFLGPSFLSKQSVLDAPLFGTICHALQVVGVDRTSSKDKDRSKALMSRLVNNAFAPPILIVPEGTTSRTDTMMKFKTGAFMFNGAAVQPVILHYSWRFFDPANTALTPPLLWLFQVMTQFYQTVSIEFLPIVPPDEQEVSNALVYAANVRSRMVAALERRHKPFYECEQTVDDFLVWKLFVVSRVPRPQRALTNLSLAELRSVLSLATPASREAVTLTMVLACAKRYIALMTVPHRDSSDMLGLGEITACALNPPQSSGGAELTFSSAFAHAMVFPCMEPGSLIDMRAFCIALIYLSPLRSLWGPGDMPAYEGEEVSPRKWGELRAKMTFALVLAQQPPGSPARTDERLSRADFVRCLSAAKEHLDVMLPPTEEEEEERMDLMRWRDACMLAMVGDDKLPSPRNSRYDELVELAHAENAKKRRAVHAVMNAAWALIDVNFKARSNGQTFFLSDQEIGEGAKAGVA
jgi:1-acyl-sn-glycerol-3-phosphate acyltransferase